MSLSKIVSVCIVALIVLSGRAEAQVCVTFSLSDEGYIAPGDKFEVGIVTDGDTVMGKKVDKLICFAVELDKKKQIDIVVKYRGNDISLPRIYPNYLRLFNSEPTWNLVLDRVPFDKKLYPRIKRWREIASIELLEISSPDGEDGVMLYKRRKDGTYIND